MAIDGATGRPSNALVVADRDLDRMVLIVMDRTPETFKRRRTLKPVCDVLTP
jgi:hypothetical protein